MLGKTEDRRRRRRQSMKRLDGISNLMDMSLSKVGDRKVWHAAVHGVTKSWTRLSDWTELKFIFLCSDGQSCLTLCDPMECIPLDSSVHGILQTRVLECSTISPSRDLPNPGIESVMPSNHLILCHPLLLLSSVFPSIRVFSKESALCIRWPKYWSFSFNISPSNEYIGLISFRIDQFDVLAVQGTLKSLLQHHSSKVSILWH